jgi:hypothetical protein
MRVGLISFCTVGVLGIFVTSAHAAAFGLPRVLAFDTIPEPTSLALLGAGAAVLLFKRRKK